MAAEVSISRAVKRADIASGVAALIVYAGLAFAVFGSAWIDPRNLSIGSAGDAEIYMWMLGWVPFSVGHALNPLFSNFVIYPQGASLFWSLIPIVPGFLLAPVMVFLGPVVTYNLTMTLGLAGSAWCAYIAFRAVVGDRIGSWIGGLVYGFSPYMLAHALGHPNLVICVTPPLALLLLYDLCVRRRWRPWRVGVALGVLGALQLLTTPEILFTTVTVGVLGLILLALLNPREVRGRFTQIASGLGVGAAVFAVLAAVPLAFAFLGPQQVHGIVRQQDTFVTDVYNFVVPTQVMLLAPSSAVQLSLKWTGDIAEANAYIGLPLLALLAFVAVTYRNSGVIRWAALEAAVAAILSLGPHLHIGGNIHFHIPLPWLLIQRLPFFENVLPSRLMLFFYLTAGLACAFFIAKLRRMPLKPVPAFGWLWVAVSLAFLLPALPWLTTANPVPEFFSGPDATRIPAGSVALVAPFSTAPGFQLGPGQDSATLPMLWQEASGMRFRMPEGGMNVPDANGNPTGGRPPASTVQTTMIAIQQGAPAPDLTADLRTALDADLARWRVQTVIVGPMYNQGAMVELFSGLLGRPPDSEGGVYVWWGVGT